MPLMRAKSSANLKMDMDLSPMEIEVVLEGPLHYPLTKKVKREGEFRHP